MTAEGLMIRERANEPGEQLLGFSLKEWLARIEPDLLPRTIIRHWRPVVIRH